MSAENNNEIREHLVATAVGFLLNSKVRSSPLQQKKAFLQSKGLTDVEIEIAIDKSLRADLSSFRDTNVAVLPSQLHQPQPQSFLMRTMSGIPSATFVALVLYGGYLFYKKYIEPYFFKRSLKKHPLVVIEEKLKEIENTMELLKLNIAQVEVSLRREIQKEIAIIAGPNPAEVEAINELKRELSSLKSLMLSRKQFPAIPIVSNTSSSIPAWQLNGSVDDDESHVVENGEECVQNTCEKGDEVNDVENSETVENVAMKCVQANGDCEHVSEENVDSD